MARPSHESVGLRDNLRWSGISTARFNRWLTGQSSCKAERGLSKGIEDILQGLSQSRPWHWSGLRSARTARSEPLLPEGLSALLALPFLPARPALSTNLNPVSAGTGTFPSLHDAARRVMTAVLKLRCEALRPLRALPCAQLATYDASRRTSATTTGIVSTRSECGAGRR